MKSPFSDCEMVLRTELAESVFKGKTYTYQYRFYECMDTHETFTTTELDEFNVNQVYNQYRAENGIPFPDELKAVRGQFGLPASTMSVILGLGANQYRLYENGDIPNLSNGRLLAGIIRNKENMLLYLDNAKESLGRDCQRIGERILAALKETEDRRMVEWIFSNQRNVHNGYANRSIENLKNVLLFFIERFGKVYQTTMNKLLFYSDFTHYRKYGVGLTGLSYKAIQYGPVPLKFNRIYAAFDDIDTVPVISQNGHEGIVLTSKVQSATSMFTEQQNELLENICQQFSNLSPSQLSELSHKEAAWEKNIGLNNLIDYNEAFTL